MRKDSQFIVMLALTLAGAGGCAGIGPSSGSDGMLPGMSQRDKQTGPALGPANEEQYARQAQEHRDRPLVAPALGYEPQPEPNVFSRMSTAVTESAMVKTMTSAFRSKPKAAAVPKNPEAQANDPTSMFSDPPTPSAKLHIEFARAHEKQGDFAAAALQYQRATSIEPGNLQALLGQARLMDRQGEFAAAIPLYEKAVAAHAESAQAANDLGLCCARNGQHEKAVTMLKRAVKLHPDRKLYRNNLATVLVEIGRPEEALEQLSAAHPKAVAHYNLGFLLSQAGQREAASDQFAAALQVDPDLTAARQWLETLQPGDGPPHAVVAAAPQHDRRPPPRRQTTATEGPAAGDQGPVHAIKPATPAQGPVDPNLVAEPPRPQPRSEQESSDAGYRGRYASQSQPEEARSSKPVEEEAPSHYHGRLTPQASPLGDSATVVRPRDVEEVEPEPSFEEEVLPNLDPPADSTPEEEPPTPDELDSYDLDSLEADGATATDRPTWRPPSRY